MGSAGIAVWFERPPKTKKHSDKQLRSHVTEIDKQQFLERGHQFSHASQLVLFFEKSL